VSARAKATMSKDGMARISLRVEVRLSLDETATAVAMGSNEEPETIDSAGRERLLDWARDAVRNYGLDHIRMWDAAGYEDEAASARRRLVELGIFDEAQDRS
jgi:hypothetical protein